MKLNTLKLPLPNKKYMINFTEDDHSTHLMNPQSQMKKSYLSRSKNSIKEVKEKDFKLLFNLPRKTYAGGFKFNLGTNFKESNFKMQMCRSYKSLLSYDNKYCI